MNRSIGFGRDILTRARCVSVILALTLICTPVLAEEFTLQQPESDRIEYSPFIDKAFPQSIYWGDTHVHTTYSPDAGMVGNFNLGPADAYRFAMGMQVQANNGMQAKLVRPLDFLVVADHSDTALDCIRCQDIRH